MPDVDDVLRERLRRLADVPVPRLDELEQDVRGRVGRLRRRRRAGAVVVAAALLGAASVAVVGSGGGTDDLAAIGVDGSAVRPSTTPNPVVSVEVERDVEGGENVVFTFADPLPMDDPDPIDDIASFDPAGGLAYTTQQAEGALVCESRHFGFAPSTPATGTVDLLVPASWMPAGFEPNGVTFDNDVSPDDPASAEGNPGKIVGCGPYQGFVQYSIWAPTSDDIDDVSVHAADGNRIVIEIRS